MQVKGCNIVTYDFLEDCLLSNPPTYSKAAEKSHALKKVLIAARQVKKEKMRREGQILAGMKDWENLANPSTWKAPLSMIAC